LGSLDSVIVGGASNTIQASQYTVIGGGFQNFIVSESHYSTIAGGAQCEIGASAAACLYGFIGGGGRNKISGNGGDYSVIGGGFTNTISSTADYNAILGGDTNTISSTADHNAILGGDTNVIGGSYTDAFIIGSTITADASNTTFVEALKSEGDVTAFWSSDIRLKDNVRPIENALFKVKQIRGIEFEWNDKLGDRGHLPSGTTDIGVVAQDVQKVLPEIVKERKDGYLGIRYERMIPLLIEGIKDQQKQIDELKEKLDALTK